MSPPQLDADGATQAAAQDTEAPKLPRWLAIARRAAAIALLPVAVALVGWPWVVYGGYRIEWMPDNAMAPTIAPGRAIVSAARGARRIRTGGIYGVLVRAERGSVRYRRVLAQAGESVRLDAGGLARNGARVAEPYASGEADITFPPSVPPSTEPLPYSLPDGAQVALRLQGGEAVVPDGWCFVLPDNRSRVTSAERLLVPVDDIVAQLLSPRDDAH